MYPLCVRVRLQTSPVCLICVPFILLCPSFHLLHLLYFVFIKTATKPPPGCLAAVCGFAGCLVTYLQWPGGLLWPVAHLANWCRWRPVANFRLLSLRLVPPTFKSTATTTTTTTRQSSGPISYHVSLESVLECVAVHPAVS